MKAFTIWLAGTATCLMAGGLWAAPPAQSGSQAKAEANPMDIAVPALPGGGKDANGDAPPTVRATRHNGNVVEEYYQGGELYMVTVHPKHGVPYSYMVRKGRRLTPAAGAPPVNPSLYTILHWDGPSRK